MGSALIGALVVTLLVIVTIGLVLLSSPIGMLEIVFVLYVIVRLRRDKLNRYR